MAGISSTGPDQAPSGSVASIYFDGLNYVVNLPSANGTLITKAAGVTAPLPIGAAGTATKAITSGALPTVALSSGTGAQISTTRDVRLVVSCATTTAAGTVTVALSPDGNTYSTLVVLTPAITAATFAAQVFVPIGWFVKLTASNATIGTGTYY